MTAPPSTPTARELARACVHVHGDRGVCYVGYRAPGREPGDGNDITFAHFGHHNSADPRTDAERAAATLVDLLAPLVDLGLRHREAMATTRDPRPVQRLVPAMREAIHDDDDGDPDG